MAKKLRVGILFGGRSGEHEVSLLSAASVMKAIDRRKFDVVPIGIDKQGNWLIEGAAERLLNGPSSEDAGESSVVESSCDGQTILRDLKLDLVFPVLHGTFGEDGKIQGLLELSNMAYVGSGVLGSSAGMDKDVMKRLFLQSRLPIVKHVTLLRSEWEKSPRKAVASIEAELKYPVFVKPANLGSSVGISKAHDRKELSASLRLASKYDRKLVIEQGVGGKKTKACEFEVAVLGNDAPEASVVGEIVPDKEFYDYESKYLSEGSVPVIPAKISREESKQIREMAVAAFRACDLWGLARVDFLMEPEGKRKIYLNEVNTMPGFTKISMYPKLWEATGIKYRDLITRLIELALELHAEKSRNTYSREE
jgi:D-alanine-D-alanine ligase